MTDPRYKTARWRALRRVVIARDGPTCSVPTCTSDMTAPRMVCVDHVVDKKDGGEFWDPANLQVLCAPHNRAKGIQASAGRRGPTSPNG